MAKLSALLYGTELLSSNFDPETVDSGELRCDSFKVAPGDTFICIKGQKYDGHDFICVAHERGAGVIICEHITEYLTSHPEIKYLIVKNTRIAEANMWNELCGRPSDRLIAVAVTGTNGKTSVTYFLREIFKAAGYKTGIVGTVKCMVGDLPEVLSESAESHVNSMTTPPPEVLYPELRHMADEGVEIVFLEASSHSLSQHRLDPLHFILGIFTNLSPEHLDYHGTMEEYYNAKKRLLGLCGAAVINADDSWFGRMAASCPIPHVTFSTLKATSADNAAANNVISDNTTTDSTATDTAAAVNAASDIAMTGNTSNDEDKTDKIKSGKNTAANMKDDITIASGLAADYTAITPRLTADGGITYDLLEAGRLYRISCPIPGEFTVSNTLAAITAARLFKIAPETIVSALRNCPQIPGRMERLALDGLGFEVYIDYAHTPDALERTLRTLHALKRPEGRLNLLFGCGGDRDKSKRPIMGRIATTLADFTVITSDNSRGENPRAIICDILRGVDRTAKYKVIERREDAIHYIIEHSAQGDIILLAGKGHEDYEIDADGKHPFSERDIVYAAVRSMPRCDRTNRL